MQTRNLAILMLLAAMQCALAGSAPCQEQRYVASFADGRRVEGNRLIAWHDTKASPKLDDTPLTGVDPPLRWLIDLALVNEPAVATSSGRVELVGGDRLPGTVIGFVSGEEPLGEDVHGFAQLLIKPDVPLHFPTDTPLDVVHVLLDSVRRVVWGPTARQDVKPGTLYFRDGRELKFRSVRWSESSVRVLLKDGPRSVEFHQLAEIHLPVSDRWAVLNRELAVLVQQEDERLLRLETTDGVVVTGSHSRFRASNHGSSSDPARWYHRLQPAWSLDPVWLPVAKTRTRLYFSPSEIPLSRLEPANAMQRSLLGGGWHWQTDRNVQGGPLRAGKRYHGWGIGTHAQCELTYELPRWAKTFRAKIGLDQIAGDGGCARARVFLGQVGGQPLFQSDHLIGSSRGVDTGELALPPNADGPQRLILQSHPAHYDRPEGSDPLDIRDSVDWLEPLVTLDADSVAEKSLAERRYWIPAWRDWTLETANLAPWKLVSEWDTQAAGHGSYVCGALATDGSLVLTRKLRVTSETPWLLLAVRRLNDEGDVRLAVRIDGEQVADFLVPTGRRGVLDPISVPLEIYRGREITVQLEQYSQRKPAPVFWDAIVLSPVLPGLAEVFEDAPEQQAPLPQQGSSSELVAVDPYSGTRALRITSAAEQGVRIGPLELAIREQPRLGEYRYLRFALRFEGESRLGLELTHDGQQAEPFRYDAGVGTPIWERAVRVYPSAPPQWVVVTRDLYADFGEFNLIDLSLLVAGKSAARIDHVYLARQKEDFDLIGAQAELSPAAANAKAAHAMFQQAIEKAKQSLVRIDVGGRRGVGVIISPEGHVASTGYVTVTPGVEAQFTMPDGRKLPGLTLGIQRENDAGMLKIEGKGPWPFLDLWTQTPSSHPQGGRWAALAYLEDEAAEPVIGSAVVRYHAENKQPAWVSLAFRREFSGGPLINQQGQLVGLLSRPFGPGGTLAVNPRIYYHQRLKMRAAKVEGNWPAAVTPLLGLDVTRHEDKLLVTAVRDGSPAARAGVRAGDRLDKFAGQEVGTLQQLTALLSAKLPDDQVPLELTRDEASQSITLKLDRR